MDNFTPLRTPVKKAPLTDGNIIKHKIKLWTRFWTRKEERSWNIMTTLVLTNKYNNLLKNGTHRKLIKVNFKNFLCTK